MSAIVYNKYIVGSVQWALNGLENWQVENKSCSASQFSTGALGCLVLLVLNQSDVAGVTLTSQLHGADPHKGQFTRSGREHGEPRYWTTTAPLVG